MSVCHIVKASLLSILFSTLSFSHPLNQERAALPGATFTGCVVYVNARSIISMSLTKPTLPHSIHLPGTGDPCENTDMVKRTITVHPTPEPEVVLQQVEPSPETEPSIIIKTTISTILQKRLTATDYVNARRTPSVSLTRSGLDPAPTNNCPGGYINARGEPIDPFELPNLDTRQLKCPSPLSGPDARRSVSIPLDREQAHVGPPLHTPCPGGYVNARAENVDVFGRIDGDGDGSSECPGPPATPGAGGGAVV